MVVQTIPRRDAIDRLRALARSKLDLEFSDQSTWTRDRIANLGNVQLGRQRAPKYTTGKFNKPYLRVVNVLDGRLDLRDVEMMDFNDRDFARYSLQLDDILITEGDLRKVCTNLQISCYARCSVFGTIERHEASRPWPEPECQAHAQAALSR